MCGLFVSDLRDNEEEISLVEGLPQPTQARADGDKKYSVTRQVHVIVNACRALANDVDTNTRAFSSSYNSSKPTAASYVGSCEREKESH